MVIMGISTTDVIYLTLLRVLGKDWISLIEVKNDDQKNTSLDYVMGIRCIVSFI